MSPVPEAVVDEEREPEAAGGSRRRQVALAVAAVVVTAGTAVAVCCAVRRPGRRDIGSPVTQIGLLNVVSRPNVHRPVLRAGLRPHRDTGPRRPLPRVGPKR